MSVSVRVMAFAYRERQEPDLLGVLFLLDEFVALRHMKEAELGVAKGRKGVAMLYQRALIRTHMPISVVRWT